MNAIVSNKRRIGEMLVEAGLVTEGQLREALAAQKKQGGRIVEILISLGYLDAPRFQQFLARQPGIPSIDLNQYEISSSLISLIPKEFALTHEVFPIDKMGRLLTVGMVCPLDDETVRHLEQITNLRVKPLLCSASALREAIHRYYGNNDAAGEIEVDLNGYAPAKNVATDSHGFASQIQLASLPTLIKKIQDLPGLPDTVQHVRDALRSPDVSVHDVAEIIARDAAIAARILKVANSAAYGFAHRVSSLNLAVSLLGLRETNAIVMSAAVINVLDGSKKFDYRAYWRASFCTAAAAHLIARACGHDTKNSVQSGVFSAALLQDIGRLALVEVAPERYARIDVRLSGPELVAAEESYVGFSHAEAGFELAMHWGLPQDMATAIRFHHRLEDATNHEKLAAIIALSDVIYRADTVGSRDMLTEGAAAQQRLGLSGHRVEEIFSRFHELREKISEEEFF